MARSLRSLALGAVLLLLPGLPAAAHPSAADDVGSEHQHAANQLPTRQERMSEVFNSPTGQINSDLAFWGDFAFAGDYGGFRIFDISGPTPQLISDFRCFGPQNDVSVWDRDRDGQADLLFTSVDRTLTGPECGATATEHDDPSGWEGIRIFDVTDPAAPAQIGAVYQDCGSHTHTLVPDPARSRLLLYNSSYPLRPGPTCGPVRGPQAGRDPLHGVIQVVEVPLANPGAASELTELPITYPGDPDDLFIPAEHGLDAPGLVQGMRACHDMAVFVELRLVAAACVEQAQLWRIGPDMLADTANPLWVFDNPVDTDGPGGGDTAADFWHSATFTWDGKVVNFSDESFGDGCPPVTTITESGSPVPSDTGRTYFLDVATGTELSQFMIPRSEDDAYCSTHQGNVVPVPGRYILAQAWYMGGVNLVDFTSKKNPREIAYFDRGPGGATGSDNWTHYWYERAPKPGAALRTYGQDGIHDPAAGHGFQAFDSSAVRGRRVGLTHLNPQTQERVLFR